MKIKISEIIVDEGRRPIDKSSVANLAGSIKTVGLLNPVTVTKDHHLIAGAHRLEAYKLLGLTEIECNVMEISGLEAELAEIDENIVRHDIDPIDNCSCNLYWIWWDAHRAKREFTRMDA